VTLVIVFCLGEGLNEIGFIVEFTFVSGSLSTQAANVAATIITRICFMPAAYARAMAGQGRGRIWWGAMTKPARGENRPLGHPSRAKCVGIEAAGSCIRPLRYQKRYQTSTLHPRCSAGIVFRKDGVLVRFWK